MKLFTYIVTISLLLVPLSALGQDKPKVEKTIQHNNAQESFITCILMWAAFGTTLDQWYTVRNQCKTRLSIRDENGVASVDALLKLKNKRDGLFLAFVGFAVLGLYEGYKVWRALGKQEVQDSKGK